MTAIPSSQLIRADDVSSARAPASSPHVGLPAEILKHSFDCIKVLDASGLVLWINEQGLELMELCDLGQVLGAPWHGFWAPSEQTLITEALETARAGGIGRFRGPCRTAQGTPKWWDVVVTSMRDGENDADRLLVISREITALMTVSLQRDELLERERVARLDAEAAIRARDDAFLLMAHELRAPLNAVCGWAELLRADIAPQEDYGTGLRAIAQNAMRMSALVDALTDAARASTANAADRKPNEVAAILQSAMEGARPAARARGITLRADPFIGALVLADFHAAHRAVTNLLFNAIKFTPEGGFVDVRCARSGNHARIEVSDTGIGIDPAFMPKLFEPFSQAGARDDRGFGLGLSIVRGIVQAHGGSVEAFSDGPGRGATFAMTLPVAS